MYSWGDLSPLIQHHLVWPHLARPAQLLHDMETSVTFILENIAFELQCVRDHMHKYVVDLLSMMHICIYGDSI